MAAIILSLLCVHAAAAKDGIFELVFEDPPNARPDGESLLVTMPLKPRSGLKFGNVYLNKFEGAKHYTITIDVPE